jgi:N-acyl-D-amino-acid deacylase
MIAVAEATGAHVQLSHLMPSGPGQPELLTEIFDLVDSAVDRGVSVAMDRYPYSRGMTTPGLVLPEWVHEGGLEAMLRRLGDDDELNRMEAEVDALSAPYGYDEMWVIRGGTPEQDGSTFADLAARWHTTPARAIARVMIEAHGAATMSMTIASEETQLAALLHPRCSVGSDGIPSAHGTHPRTFGTFAKVLGPLVRDGVLSLEQAVHKMTGLPAEQLQLHDRGAIDDGAVADLVLFDPEVVADNSTFEDPYAFCSGIEEVFIAGQPVLTDGSPTGERHGEVLTVRRAPGERSAA